MRESTNFSTNIAFFNYLKAIAIIMVIIHHYAFSQVQFQSSFFLYLIYMAVPIFMFVTGFVYTKSFQRNSISGLKDFNHFKIILKRIFRITLPFALIFLLEYLFNLKGLRSSNHLFIDFIQGGVGVGKGSYYYPVILQIILIFPLIFTLMKRFNYIGFMLLFLFEFIYSFYCYNSNVPILEYRLQAFRYITLVASGVWLALKPEYEIKKKYLIISFIVGIIYIYIAGYINNYSVLPCDYTYWKNSSGIFIVFYIFPILYWLFKKFEKTTANKIYEKIFDNIGKASWHIFLVQMFYYLCINQLLDGTNFYLHITLNLICCITVGILFYYTEKKLQNSLKVKFYLALQHWMKNNNCYKR